MKAIHRVEDVTGYFFLLLVGVIPHEEMKVITNHLSTYNYGRRYISIGGHKMLAIVAPAAGEDDTHLAEAWCSGALRESGVWKCPICEERGEHGNCCGHRVFERIDYRKVLWQ